MIGSHLYDPLEDRRIDDVIVKNILPLFIKMAESFENLNTDYQNATYLCSCHYFNLVVRAASSFSY